MLFTASRHLRIKAILMRAGEKRRDAVQNQAGGEDMGEGGREGESDLALPFPRSSVAGIRLVMAGTTAELQSGDGRVDGTDGCRFWAPPPLPPVKLLNSFPREICK